MVATARTAERAWPARAKLNLYLHVTGRRPDGYHQLDSLVAFADEAADTVAVTPADTLSLTIAGPFAAHVPAGGDNLVLRAAGVLRSASGIASGAAIALTKSLPPASGIGGGSADAAATLAALAELWGVRADLPTLALALGADVPMCLHGRAARIGGIGEQIDEIPPLPPVFAVLVNPGEAVATPAVFAALRAADMSFSSMTQEPGGFADAADLCRWLAEQRNDLQPYAAILVPAIADRLAALSATGHCLLARMSGSGATCFGLYAASFEAEWAAAELRRDFPRDWIVVSALR